MSVKNKPTSRRKKKVTKKAPATQQSQQVQPLDPNQVASAANAGLKIINHESGVIPNSVRGAVPALEQILAGLVKGQLAVVVVQQPEQQGETKEE